MADSLLLVQKKIEFFKSKDETLLKASQSEMGSVTVTRLEPSCLLADVSVGFDPSLCLAFSVESRFN